MSERSESAKNKRRKKHHLKDEKSGMSFEYTKKKDGTIVCECTIEWHPDYKFPDRSFINGNAAKEGKPSV